MTTLLIAEHDHEILKDATNKALTAAKPNSAATSTCWSPAAARAPRRRRKPPPSSPA